VGSLRNWVRITAKFKERHYSGKQRKRSDVDILVEFDVVPGLLKFIELEDYISELLGMKADLVRKKSIREELRERILGEVVMP